MSPLLLLFKLLIGHALADYPLQGDFLARGKNRHLPPIISGEKYAWVYCMTAHSLIHAGAVWVITGSGILAFVELVAHWIIDFAKCEDAISFGMDQWLHIAVKATYAMVLP